MTPNEKLRTLQANLKKMAVLSKQLEASDYKIIKCYEYFLAGLETPYDIDKLHKDREAIREEIRAIEGLI